MNNNDNNENNNKKTVKFSKKTTNKDINNNKKNLHIRRDNSNNKLQIYNKKKDINSKNIFLSMEFEDIIDNIRKQRLKNKKDLQIKEYVKISNQLDLQNKESITLNSETPLKLFLDNIDANFNNRYVNDFNYKNDLLNQKISPLVLTPPIKIERKKVNIICSIENLKDLLKLINDYPLKPDIEYNINMKALHNVKPSLISLDNMIGMHELKNSVVDQILYYIQDLNKCDDFMHTVIYGPPGTGKTEIAKLIGHIFAALGILKTGIFKKATRADLIAGYLGQTAIKTKQMMESCLGGVLFIDEAYALGNNERRDSFAKECIDTICETLSDYKSNLMVIIAGYKEELDDCFFAYNKGLDSRFPWRFKTDDYNSQELKDIFIKKVKENKWNISPDINSDWFEKNMEYFKFYGRDMETLLSKIKIAHSRRVFCKPDKKKYITIEDLNNGFDKFLNNSEVKNRNNTPNIIPNMYL